MLEYAVSNMLIKLQSQNKLLLFHFSQPEIILFYMLSSNFKAFSKQRNVINSIAFFFKFLKESTLIEYLKG